MNSASAKGTVTVRLPQLAAMILVFLGLSTNTRLDAAPVWQLQGDLPPHEAKQAKTSFNAGDDIIHVLSGRDASLYRVAFAAQEAADWKFADEALAQVKDKRLVGHILADRYLRRDFSLDEIKSWMASYSDSSEATKLYERAKKLPGFGTSHLRPPATAASWSGNNGSGSSFGFRSTNDNDDLGPKGLIGSKINAVLRRGDPIKARELLTTELQRGSLSATDASEIVGRIAAAFFYEGEIERARSMARTAAGSGAPLGLWVEGLSAWKQQDFGTAAHSFARLAETSGLSSWDQAAASYWAYRATSRLGDKKQSYRWLAEAAKFPSSFYGAMATRLIGHRSARSWKMPELTVKNINLLAEQPAGWQALALVQVGRNSLAQSELRRLIPAASRELRAATLALAEKAQMPSLTLQLSGVATNDNGQPFDGALYPVPPWQPKDGFKVDRALMYALMRHESQFDPKAVSSSGACGLMQIMPSTARQIANENVVTRRPSSPVCSEHLFDPSTNMDMGQRYVRVLAGQPKIGDNLLLILAAYNGGPGNLARWLDGKDLGDPLLFVESLPVRETRDYVQQVLLQYWMYQSRLSQTETTVAQLAHGEWPRYAGLRDEGTVKRAVAQGLELASIELVKMDKVQ